MANIKTKDVMKGTIKVIDKAVVAADRMKSISLKTKEQAETSYCDNDNSLSEYAISSAGNKANLIVRKGGYMFSDAGKSSVKEAKQQFIKAKDNIQQTRDVIKMRKTPAYYSPVKRRKLKGRTVIKGVNHNTVKGSEALKRKLAAAGLRSNMRKAKYSGRTARRIAVPIARTVKAAVVGVKVLVSALIAGGWIAVIVIIICCLFGAAFYFFGDENLSGYTPVSQEVEGYTPVIEKYAKEYGVAEYVQLIKAVMMQESGGKGNDPMQASECGFNKKYSKKPNGITDPEYSISCGIQNLKAVLKEAKVQNPVDMDRIKLALQGYNFGNGYISWAVGKYGGYTKANAVEFSKAQAQKSGWSSYGDIDYVEHVLKYYPYGNYSYDIVFNGIGKLGLPIKGMTQSNISSHFGSRSSPGGIGSTNHQGIDIAFPLGTHVLACESGTVVSAGWNGGFGKCIIIDHEKGLQTVYGHLSKIHVRKGQKVVRGQFIGEVGSTGDSTGPHLHLGVMLNGKFVNPEKGYLNIPK